MGKSHVPYHALLTAQVQEVETPEAGSISAAPPLPTVQLMKDFCYSAIIDPYMHRSLGMLKDTVTAITQTHIVMPEDVEVTGEVLPLQNSWNTYP